MPTIKEKTGPRELTATTIIVVTYDLDAMEARIAEIEVELLTPFEGDIIVTPEQAEEAAGNPVIASLVVPLTELIEVANASNQERIDLENELSSLKAKCKAVEADLASL